MKHRQRFPLCLVMLSLASAVHGDDLSAGRVVAAASAAEAQGWAARIDAMVRAGELSLERVQRDADFPGREHRRYDQRIAGLPAFGYQLTQQVDEGGRTLSVFGHLLEGTLEAAAPRLSPEQAAVAARAAAGRDAAALAPVELVVLPVHDRHALVYTLVVATQFERYRYFIDAETGAAVLHFPERETDAAVGSGTGLWGEVLKVSADRVAAGFNAEDRLRPARVSTFDLHYDFFQYDRIGAPAPD